MRNLALLRTVLGLVAAMPTTVLAHPGFDHAHDLLHGLAHPFTGLDHVLAMVAVGFVAARLGGRALWAVPVSFVATMAVAGAIGMRGIVLPGLETGIALSVVVLGALVSLRVRLPVCVAAATVAVFAVFHGYSHGLELGGARSGIAFGLGFTAATAMLHLTGIGVGVMTERIGVSFSHRFARAGGSVMVLAGLMLLAGRLS